MNGELIELVILVVDFDQPLYAMNMVTGNMTRLADARGVFVEFEAPLSMIVGAGTATFTCGNDSVSSIPGDDDGPPRSIMVTPPTNDPAASLLAFFGGFDFGGDVYHPTRWAGVFILSLTTKEGILQKNTNFTKADFPTCHPTLHFANQLNPLQNSNHETVSTSSVEFTTPTQPNCTYEGIVKYTEDLHKLFSFLKSTSDPHMMRQLEFSIAVFKIRDEFVGCSDMLKSFATFTTSTVDITTDKCSFDHGTPQFAADPCCNHTLSYKQCCAPRVVPVPVKLVSGFDQTAIAAECGSPSKMFSLLTDSSIAFNRLANSADFSPSSQWKILSSMFNECHQRVFQSRCKVDNDCPSKSCSMYSGTCMVQWGEHYQLLMSCFAEKIPSAIKAELRAYWNLSVVSPTDPDVEGQEFLSKVISDTAFDCVGPMTYDHNTQQQFNAHYEYQRNPETGNYESVYVPGNETLCLAQMGCTADLQRYTDQSSCTNNKPPHFCGECFGSQCWEISEFPRCFVAVNNQQECDAVAGFWVQEGNYCLMNSAFNVTEAECIDEHICPPIKHDSSDKWRCTWSFCYNDVIMNNNECDNQNDFENGKHGYFWVSELRNGTGLCVHPGNQNNAVVNSAMCSSLGADWQYHQGRMFQDGRYNTEEKCNQGACSIWNLRYQGASKAECESTHYCTMNCERCASNNEFHSPDQSTLCFSDEFQQNCSYGEWTNLQGQGDVCRYKLTREECTSKGFHFVSCEDYNKTTCSSGVFVDRYFSYLQCSYSYWASCPNQDSCESVGRCDDEGELTNWVPSGNPILGSCLFPFMIDEGGMTHCGESNQLRWTRLGCAVQGQSPPANEPECALLGGQWHAVAHSEAECTAHGTVCDEPDRWDNTPKNASECTRCDGTMVPIYSWHPGVWASGYMKNTIWKERKWAHANEWKQVVQEQVFQEAFQIAVGKYLGKLILNTVLDSLSLLGQLVLKTACDCGTQGSLGDHVCWAGVIEAQVLECTGRPNSKCGSLRNLADTINSTLPAPTIAGYTAPATQFTNTTASSFTRAFAAIGNSAQYAVITNQKGIVVGQLVGDGAKYQFSQAPSGPFELCLTVRADIDQDVATYPVLDFANSTASGAPAGPMNTTINVVGDEYCATLPASQAGTTFYPILRFLVYNNGTDDNPVVDSASHHSFSVVVALAIVAIFTLFWI